MSSNCVHVIRLYLILMVLPVMVMSCLYPIRWQPRNFTTRVPDAEMIVMGRVTAMIPLTIADPPIGYSAAFKVQCVYKAPLDFVEFSVMIQPVNFSMSCSETTVRLDQVYLMFLKMNSGVDDGVLKLKPDEVNREAAQFPADGQRLDYLQELYGAGRDMADPGCPTLSHIDNPPATEALKTIDLDNDRDQPGRLVISNQAAKPTPEDPRSTEAVDMTRGSGSIKNGIGLPILFLVGIRIAGNLLWTD